MEILDVIGQTSILIFVITFYFIVRKVRSHNNLVRNAVTNFFLPNIDLRFIPWVYGEYVNITKSKLLVSVSIISGLVSLIIALFVLASGLL